MRGFLLTPWACPGAGEDCYPESTIFGPYAVRLYRENRPDIMTFATGHAGTLRQVRSRLRSILVQYAGSPMRAMKLTYSTSPSTGRSLLTSVQEFGKDVVIDGGLRITPTKRRKLGKASRLAQCAGGDGSAGPSDPGARRGAHVR
jgi:hypothetical protein